MQSFFEMVFTMKSYCALDSGFFFAQVGIWTAYEVMNLQKDG